MKKSSLLLTLLSVTITFLVACSKSDDDGGTDNCSGVPKTWSADVSPIIQSFCNQAGCHNAGSGQGVGPLTNYSEVFSNRFAIKDAVKEGRMPQNTTLSTAQKNTIICWIDSGAPNN